MMRCLLLLASLLFSAPAFWVQKSIGTNPVAPFTLAKLDTLDADSSRVSGLSDSAKALVRYTRITMLSDSLRVERAFDTTVARAIAKDTAIQLRAQIHDTADTLRKYTRDRIHDTSLVLRQRIADSTTAVRAKLASDLTNYLPLSAGSGKALTGDLYTSSSYGIWFGNALGSHYWVNVASTGGAVHGTGAKLRVGAADGAWVEADGFQTPTGTASQMLRADGSVGAIAGADLPNSGVTVGTYGGATTSMVGVVNSKGILTGASSVTITPAWADITGKPTVIGTVTSVGLNAPALMTASGSPVTSAGTLGLAWNGSSANMVLANGSTVAQSTFTTGSGGNNYFPKFTGSNSLGSSPLFDMYTSGAGYAGINNSASSLPAFSLTDQSQGTDAKNWVVRSSGSVFAIGPFNDAWNSGNNALSITRTGETVSGIQLQAPAVDLTSLSAGGIAKAAPTTGRLGIATPGTDYVVPSGSITGNAATATKWATARNLTIGSSTQALDGTSDKTFTLAAIGAQAALSGGSTNSVTKWTGAGSIGNSQIADDGTTVTLPSAKVKSYDATYAGIWGGSVASPTNLNYVLLYAKDGSTAGLNGTTSSGLSVNGSAVVTASSSGLTIAGTTNITSGSLRIAGTDAITSGRAGALTSAVIGVLGLYSYDVNYSGIWGGSVGSRTSLNYGLMVALDGSGAGLNGSTASSLGANGSAVVTATTSGATLAGTTTLSSLTGATTRLATINAAGQVGALAYQFDHFPITGSTSISVPGVYSVRATCTITLPTPSASTLGNVYWINNTGAYTVTINPGASIIGYTPGMSAVSRQTFQGVQTGASTYAWLCGS
jgi:hypothetical protein